MSTFYVPVGYEPPAPVTSVTMRQAHLVLLTYGLLDAVDAAIAAIPDDFERAAAQIEWNRGSVVERTSPLVTNLMPALGLSPAQIDELFQIASTL